MGNWFTALMWEKWRRIRVPFMILCAVPLILRLSWVLLNLLEYAYGIWDAPARHDFEEMMTGFLVWYGLILILALMLIHGQRNNLHFGLDVAHFKLPVSSVKLALGQLFFGAVMIVSFVAISLAPMLLTDLADEFIGNTVICSLLFVLLYLLTQTLSWWIGPLSTIGAIVMLAGLVLPMAATIMIIWREYEPIVAFLWAGGVVVIVPLLCIAAVHLQRTGVLGTLTVRGLLQTVKRDAGFGGDDFPSAEAAHRWYEWRRKGRILPLVFTVIAVSNLALALISPSTFCGLWGEPQGNSFRLGDSPIPYLPFMLEQNQYLLLMCALSIGLIVSTFAYREYVSGVATFHFTKPVSTKEMARSYGWVSIRACLISGAVLVIALSPSVFLWMPELPNWAIGLGLSLGDGWTSNLVLGALWGITLLGAFILTWVALTFGIPLLGYLVFIAICILLVELVLDPWAARDAYEFLQGLVILISAISSGVVTYAASRRQILDRKDIARFMAAWPLIAVCLINGQARTFGLSLDASSVIPIIFTALLAPVVTLPFALWPLIIEWQRHR